MSGKSLQPFHIAIRVRTLAEARRFYGELLGCPEGRSSDSWVDFDFFGHQLVCHLAGTDGGEMPAVTHNEVDGHKVPVPHFGVVLDLTTWERLSKVLRSGGIRFIIEPQIRFKGRSGEQATMFLLDPSGNAIEFKAFQNIAEQLFATRDAGQH